jgi:hypothetical protein
MGSFLARAAGLGTNPPVADADKLDGLDSTSFATQATVAALEARVAELEATLAAVSYDDAAKVFRFDGVNVQIVDGSGDTSGTPNGFGNLIVGYNEGSQTRTGSHNLVIGEFHTYTSWGGIVAGWNNAITARNASVTGGEGNTASGPVASVSGGDGNTASGPQASVSGGESNTASGRASSASGGGFNTASGTHASVTGGSDNTAGGVGFSDFTSVTGGRFNVATGSRASVSGGVSNTADTVGQWLGGTLAIRSASIAVPGGAVGNGAYATRATEALCQAGEQLLSGGAHWDTDADDLQLPLVYSRALATGNGWRAKGGNDTGASQILTVQALCLGP